MRMIGIALAASTTLFKDNPIRIVILTSKVGFFFHSSAFTSGLSSTLWERRVRRGGGNGYLN
jgi:hypothetical protein